MATRPPQPCAICTQPTAQQCRECDGGFDTNGDQIPPVSCCGSEQCKGAHQAACRESQDLRDLYRAGEFVQEHWYEFRRQWFEGRISSARPGPGEKTYVSAGGFPQPSDGILVDFPGHLFEDPDDRKAMLAFNQCNDAMFRMHELVCFSLQGIVGWQIQDVLVTPKPDSSRLIWTSLNGARATEADEHCLYRVVVAGQSFAFDLTSAQYSHFRTITPWNEYLSKLGCQHKQSLDFGSICGLMQQLRRGETAASLAGRGPPRIAAVRLIGDAYQEHMELMNRAWLKGGQAIFANPLRRKTRVQFRAMLEERLEAFRDGVKLLSARMDNCEGGILGYLGIPRSQAPAWQVWHVK